MPETVTCFENVREVRSVKGITAGEQDRLAAKRSGPESSVEALSFGLVLGVWCQIPTVSLFVAVDMGMWLGYGGAKDPDTTCRACYLPR